MLLLHAKGHLQHGMKSLTGCCARAGAALVPVFCFGQTDMFHWAKLGPPLIPQWLAERIARAIKFLPLLMWGAWGSPVPRKVCLPASAALPGWHL